ncbi:hypothetical protein OK074_4229 [Actinobacteria bacterium OK074]|nr:hypothetical protein OK074_4229 [Actinobacteria bacterium OK074]
MLPAVMCHGPGRERPGSRALLKASAWATAVLLSATPVLLPGVATAEPGAAARAVVAAGKKPTPSGRSLTQLDDWFDTPVGRMALVAREARRLENKPLRNMAVGFVDITGLEDLDTAGYEIVDVDELKGSDPALYQQLGLADRPQIQKFAIIRQSNNASSKVSENHSEVLMIKRELPYLGVRDSNRVFFVGSDRSPCKSCAPQIPKDADVVYGVKDGKGSTTELEERIAAAKSGVEKDGTFKKEVAQERARIEERKKAAPRRKARLAKQTRTFFQTDPGTSGSCGLGLGSHPSGVQQAAFTSTSTSRAVPADCGDSDESKSGTAAGVPQSGLVTALSQPVAQAPGGIDFSSLQLRYLSDPGDGSGLQYSFQAPTSTTGGTAPVEGVDAARLTSDAFFVWLELHPSTFWVNLNPTEPDRIVDADMGRTDVGRIMLQADLRLKKDVGALIHPDTALGKKYYARLDGTCSSSRVWIVPAAADVRRDGDKLYILKAPLKVKMESEYLQLPADQESLGSCPKEDDATRAHNEALFRSLVLPELTKRVNTAAAYADLRRVYLARVAAQWYRDLSQSQQTTYGGLVDQGDINSWKTRTTWKPKDTFDRYVRSYTKGDYHVTRTVTKGNYRYTYTYVYGGVDLTSVPLHQVSDSSFDTHYSGLSKDVDASLTHPSGGGDSGALWLGSPTPLQAAGLDAPDAGSTSWLRDVTAPRVLLPVLLVPLAVLLLWRRSRRLSTAGTASPLRRAAVQRDRRDQRDRRVPRGRKP